MFCRFGSLLLRRPVAATAWLNDVCTRPVIGFDQLRQRVDVRALQLLQGAPLEHEPGNSCVKRELFENFDGRRYGLGPSGPSAHRQLQLLEEDVSQLFRRVDVELDARQFVDRGRSAPPARLRSAAIAPRAPDRRSGYRRARCRPAPAPAAFRALDRPARAVRGPGPVAAHRRAGAQRSGAFAGEGQDCGERELAERRGLHALAADVFFAERFVAEVLERRVLQTVRRSRRIEQIAGEHRVKGETLERHPLTCEHQRVGFEVVPDLWQAIVFEQRAQGIEHLPRLEARFTEQGALLKRDCTTRAASRSRGRGPRCPRESRSVCRAALGVASLDAPRTASTNAASSASVVTAS